MIDPEYAATYDNAKKLFDATKYLGAGGNIGLLGAKRLATTTGDVITAAGSTKKAVSKAAIISGSFGSGGSSGNDSVDAGGSEDKLPQNRIIDSKVQKQLKRMGLDKKFNKALEKGLAPRREGTSGIIKLTDSEIISKSGFTYTYKLKVPKAGGHTRVYGRIDDAGELIFDYLFKK